MFTNSFNSLDSSAEAKIPSNLGHPCFDSAAKSTAARLHLPVAPKCNLLCGFCNRKYSCVNESRPGVTTEVISPVKACELACQVAKDLPNLSTIAIAGPGDPLANSQETFQTFRLIRQNLPKHLLCLASNGLNLPASVAEIIDLKIEHLSITVNAVDPEIGSQIYQFVECPTGKLHGKEAAEYLLANQEEGIRKLANAGISIKINSVIIPGVNDAHAGTIAYTVAKWGAELMNCMPLIPVPNTKFAITRAPKHQFMCKVRAEAEKYLPQMVHCQRCRADALGLIGQKQTLSSFLNAEKN